MEETTTTNNSSNVIKSNLEFVNEEMDKLIMGLDNSISHFEKQSLRETYTSSEPNNKLYTKINNMVNEYSLAQKMLMEKLKKEANFAKYSAKIYDDLDKSI